MTSCLAIIEMSACDIITINMFLNWSFFSLHPYYCFDNFQTIFNFWQKTGLVKWDFMSMLEVYQFSSFWLLEGSFWDLSKLKFCSSERPPRHIPSDGSEHASEMQHASWTSTTGYANARCTDLCYHLLNARQQRSNDPTHSCPLWNVLQIPIIAPAEAFCR